MKNEKEIRWLQLSDLHMFESTEAKRQKKKLYEQFGETTDFVVITGDLHQYACDYESTCLFLEEIVDNMRITKEDIIMVPGNHDVEESEKRKLVVSNIDAEIENNIDVYLPHLDECYKAFGKYSKFQRRFYGNKVEEGLKNHIYVWKNKIGILCINTALISDQNHHKPQIIDINGLEAVENSGLPCIAIMHHDYYAISDMHKPYLNSRFKELDVGAVLCGHRHRYMDTKIQLEDKVIPNYCCAKSFAQPSDLWSEIGLIEYRWNTDENVVYVIPYVWIPNKLLYGPITVFEKADQIKVDIDGNVTFKEKFQMRKNSLKESEKNEKKEMNVEKHLETVDMDKSFEQFFESVQKKYLDYIVAAIGNDGDKYNRAISIVERIITYHGKRIKFNEIIEMILSCKEKVKFVLEGLQGAGKSTFLSLVYCELFRRSKETNIIPVFLDLHTLSDYSKETAKKMLSEDLLAIDLLMRKHQEKQYLLIFDGVDDYIRKTTYLEKILYDFVTHNTNVNFAFCIGTADYLPNPLRKKSEFQKFYNDALHRIEAHRIKKSDDESLTIIINNMLSIFSFNVDSDQISVIKKAINVYTINKVDYRTLLMVLRVFDMKRKTSGYQLGSYFYDYYLSKMNNSETQLYKHAEATYKYVIKKDNKALRNLKYAKIIHKNGITVDFLLAYYFVNLIKQDDDSVCEVLNSNFVFTASVNKFIKDLLFNKYRTEQSDLVEKMINVYSVSDLSMKSQLCYILGRMQENHAKEKARDFLKATWETLYGELFQNDILISKKDEIKNELVLFRTVSVSLIWLGYDHNQEKFLRCLLQNEKLNQINRGFHLEYYEDKAYMNGVSPTYIDNKEISVEKTMGYLINNISKGFSQTGNFNKSIYLDIVTLFSIYQYRIDQEEIRKKYQDILLQTADKILQSPRIQSRVIVNYVLTMKELLFNEPYNVFVQELYGVKTMKRKGWVNRNIKSPESIAEHMYTCYILGVFFLPNNIQQCIDYSIPDIENYEDYSKDKILRMLLLHDLAESKLGDIVTSEKSRKDIENEDFRYDFYEFVCSFPKMYGLGNQKYIWDEFKGKSTINAQIANDIDKIEPLIQAYIYKKSGEAIDLGEWEDDAQKKVRTSLGKQLLEFVLGNILER